MPVPVARAGRVRRRSTIFLVVATRHLRCRAKRDINGLKAGREAEERRAEMTENQIKGPVPARVNRLTMVNACKSSASSQAGRAAVAAEDRHRSERWIVTAMRFYGRELIKTAAHPQ